MIDFTLILSPIQITERTIPQFENPYFTYKTVLAENHSNCMVHHLQNPNYEIQKLQIDNFIVFIEGCIYNTKTSLLEKIGKLLSYWEKPELQTEIEKFQIENDGEFNIYILQKEQEEIKRMIFFNDALGRLMTFYTIKNDSFVITRNLKLLIPYLESKSLNVNFIADSLIFGFPIDNKTIYNEIETSNEGQIIDVCIDENEKNLKIINHNSHIDFTYKNKFKRKEEYVEHVLPLIKKSIANRLDFIGDQNFCCDITGGFDSRTVFGFLTQNKNVKFTTNLNLGDERKTVYQLIDKYNLRDKLTVIPEEEYPEDKNFHQLLFYLQNFTGNYKANSICWQALETQKKIINTKYRIGGIGFTDFIRKGIRNDKMSLIDNFSSANPYGLTIDQAIKLLNISKDDYLEHLNNTIDKWPEKTNAEIHKRFFYLRTLILQTRLTEDRERYQYWTIHPLWNHTLCFDTLRHFPLQWRGYHIHYLLLKAIDPHMVDVDVNKSYLDIRNERALKTIDFKENSHVYRKLKDFLKKDRTKSIKINGVEDIHDFMLNHKSDTSGYNELDYIKLSFDQLNSKK